jgi:nicotinate-nucleotide adenylyltransferase
MSAPLRAAVYGGSFNPPHVGHALVCGWLRWTGLVDEVWLVPVFRHAFEGRQDKTLAPFPERLAWCAAMAADLGPWARVLDVEAQLPVPSYTLDTLRHLRAAHPGAALRLVVGADVLPQVGDWHGWEQIVAEFDPIIVGRQGAPRPPEAPEGCLDFPDVSSTEVRARLLEGRPLGHLLTRSVAAALGPAPSGGGAEDRDPG